MKTVFVSIIIFLIMSCKFNDKEDRFTIHSDKIMEDKAFPKKAWWKEAVVYQIYPRSFKDSNGDGIGDIQGIISKLDYLDRLGVDVVWLSPHFDSPNADNGYDIRDYRKVMEEFGTMADFDQMLAGLKQRGIKLIIDLVVNHSSDEHEWFKQSMSSKDNPYRDYYIWKSGKDGKEPNNWPSFFGGSAWEQAGPDGEYYLHYFAKKQPDLNWENPKLREEVYDLMRFWLDKGVDGFRMDVIALISKRQGFKDMDSIGLQHPEFTYAYGPRLHEFLKEMNQKVLSNYDVMTVGEAFGGTPEMTMELTDERNEEIDLAFWFDVARIGRDNWYQNDWSLTEFKKLVKEQSDVNYYNWPTIFLTNHDNPRTVSKFGDDSPEFREPSAKLLAMLLLTQRGTPFLYQGDEIGMTNFPFASFDQFDDVEIKGNYAKVLASGISPETYLEELNQSGRDHARTPMQWSDEDQAGFTSGDTSWLAINPNYTRINVKDNLEDPNSIFHFYRKLLDIRQDNEDLIYGDYQDIAPEHPNIFAYTRTGAKATYLVILNMSSSQDALELNSSYTDYQLVIANQAVENKLLNNTSLKLGPWEGRLYQKNNTYHENIKN
ncbi:glycoside hydrolase family 13 protein [Aestuariivivens sediminis]|uniref:glycoside hydrolase family 13 protein n=1 Tax=Aestuariivivens sediminis TaxID=2913557 RepID=UPI001F56629E|nr:alpha-glucosidase [Aestuariivivens sediminis]